jgi:hypothetical protein
MGFGIKSGSKLIFYSAWAGWIWKSVHLKAGRSKKNQVPAISRFSKNDWGNGIPKNRNWPGNSWSL